ncbi:MAG: penicillin-binding protein [Candidatus Sumerlaeaceae bacterium]
MLKKTYRLRLVSLYCIPFVFMVGLVPRLYYLQVVERDYWKGWADQQHFGDISLVPSRGKIYDANGHELAGSVFFMAAYVEVKRMPEELVGELKSLAHDLAFILEKDYESILKKLRGNGTGRILLARELAEEKVIAIKDALVKYKKKIPGNAITFEPEGKRFYCRGQLAAHVVGYAQRDETGDNKGADGVEQFYDEQLRGQPEKFRARTNATQAAMEPIDSEVLAATFGNSVKLTINETIQGATEAALERGVNQNQADNGTAVVLNVKTGEVLAMANVPTFSLSDLSKAPEFTKRSRAIVDAIEPGSVMKIITFLCLLEDKKVDVDDMVDCEGGTWVNNVNRTIRDSHSMGVVPVRQVFAESSNIGTIKCARRLDSRRFYNHLLDLGFGEKTGIDLPGEVRGKLRDVRRWDGLSMSSLPMGYELRVSGIQMAAAVAAIANEGIYMQPHVVQEILDYNGKTIQRIQPTKLRRVASPVACHKVLQLMEGVVTHGTGKLAALPNYRVAGKTGTTKKIDHTAHPPTYTMKNYIASFCGVAPVENPEVCIYVSIDNPKGAKTYGGQVSAPVFREIAETAMKVLRVPVSPQANETSKMEVTLDRIRAKMEGRVPRELLDRTTDDATTGSMPDLTGLTMREVRDKLADLELEFEFSGSGVVIEQTPRAFVTIEPGHIAHITFGSESRRIRKAIQEVGPVRKTAELTSGPEVGAPDMLVLERGSRTVSVPVQPTPVHSTRGVAKPVQPGATPIPDLDEYAAGAPNSALAKQSWTQWAKEQQAAKVSGPAKRGEDAEVTRKTSRARDEDEDDKEERTAEPNFDDALEPSANADENIPAARRAPAGN